MFLRMFSRLMWEKVYSKVQKTHIKLAPDQIYPNIFHIIWYELIHITLE